MSTWDFDELPLFRDRERDAALERKLADMAEGFDHIAAPAPEPEPVVDDTTVAPPPVVEPDTREPKRKSV